MPKGRFFLGEFSDCLLARLLKHEHKTNRAAQGTLVVSMFFFVMFISYLEKILHRWLILLQMNGYRWYGFKYFGYFSSPNFWEIMSINSMCASVSATTRRFWTVNQPTIDTLDTDPDPRGSRLGDLRLVLLAVLVVCVFILQIKPRIPVTWRAIGVSEVFKNSQKKER